jgi:AcrR family transcriptional regulator
MTTRLSTATARPNSRAEGRRLPAAARRAAIVVAAREVFCAAGLHGGRMRAIAERAGVTEPLLYRHFSSREDLYRVAVEDHLTALLDDAIAGADRIAADAIDTGLERPALITALTSVYLRLMHDIAPLASVALYEEHDRGKHFYQATVRPRLRTAAAVLYRASTGAELPSGAENLVAVSLFGVPFGVALDGMLRGRPIEFEEMAGRIARLFQRRA